MRFEEAVAEIEKLAREREVEIDLYGLRGLLPVPPSAALIEADTSRVRRTFRRASEFARTRIPLPSPVWIEPFHGHHYSALATGPMKAYVDVARPDTVCVRVPLVDASERDLIETVLHELVHVSQCHRGDFALDASGRDVRWRGKLGSVLMAELGYAMLPWEVEARRVARELVDELHPMEAA